MTNHPGLPDIEPPVDTHLRHPWLIGSDDDSPGVPISDTLITLFLGFSVCPIPTLSLYQLCDKESQGTFGTLLPSLITDVLMFFGAVAYTGEYGTGARLAKYWD